MLKEKWSKIKTFVGEHKKEIITGAVLVAGTIVVYAKCKNSNSNTKIEASTRVDNYITACNKASEIANETLIPELNKKYEQYDFSKINVDPAIKVIYQQYLDEFEEKFNEIVDSQL